MSTHTISALPQCPDRATSSPFHAPNAVRQHPHHQHATEPRPAAARQHRPNRHTQRSDPQQDLLLQTVFAAIQSRRATPYYPDKAHWHQQRFLIDSHVGMTLNDAILFPPHYHESSPANLWGNNPGIERRQSRTRRRARFKRDLTVPMFTAQTSDASS